MMKTERIQFRVTVTIRYASPQARREAIKSARECITDLSESGGEWSCEPKRATLVKPDKPSYH